MSSRRRDSFVGRPRELAALDSALAEAVSGRGGVVLLVGDPGMGKTRTASEGARRARELGFEVLVGRCFEGDGAPPLWPWVQVLARYAASRESGTLSEELGSFAHDVSAICPDLRARLPDLGPAPIVDPASARFRMFEGIARALSCSAARRPVALFLDDLHGADIPSALLLQHLARHLRETRMLVVGGLRTVAFAGDHPLTAVLGELVREQVVELLRLGGLTDTEVGELLGLTLDTTVSRELATAVCARTDGNPLYVKELARTLARSGGVHGLDVQRLELPDAIRLAIGHNLGALSPGCRDLLSLASVFGREFRVELLMRASALEQRRVLSLLGEAEQKRFVEPLRDESGGWRFVHALFAETLADELTSAEREGLHRRVAEALEADSGASEHAAEIAHHWIVAGADRDVGRAVEWACRAAERASRTLAYEESARLYRSALRALDSSERPEEARRAELLLGLGESYKRVGETAAAREVFGDAAALALQHELPELLTRAALGFAPHLTFGAQGKAEPAVLRLLGQAIESWRGLDSGLHACALARLGVAHFLGDHGRVVDLLDRATAMARRLGDATALRYVLAADLTAHQARQDPARRRELTVELIELAEAARDLEALAVARLWGAVHSAEHGDIVSARREHAALAQIAKGLRQPVWDWYTALIETLIASHEGRLDDAERAAAAALRTGEVVLGGHARGYFVATMFVIRTLRGAPDDYADEYRAIYEPHPDPRALAPLAWGASERGDASAARRLLSTTCGDVESRKGDFDLFPLMNGAFATEACAFVGDRPLAERLYDLMSTAKLPFVVWGEGFALGPLDYFLGRLAVTLGRTEIAAAHFERALAVAEKCGAIASIPRTQLHFALLLREREAAGDAEQAAKLLDDALHSATRLGMSGLSARIESLSASPSHPAEAFGQQIFCRKGPTWLIASGGKQVHIPDMRGLAYLSALLREPNREFHAVDLVRIAQSPPAPWRTLDPSLETRRGLGRRDDGLDAAARAEYRRRLRELEEEVALAQQLGDLGRRSSAVDEKEAVLAELSADARSKRSGSHAERARVAVTKSIKTAIARIAESHPELGDHLSTSIRRGYLCSYITDPRVRVEWEV